MDAIIFLALLLALATAAPRWGADTTTAARQAAAFPEAWRGLT
jgi:hypothetical protein